MNWKQIEKFIEALPDNLHVVFNLENGRVEVTTDGSGADTNLPIEQFQKLWSNVLPTICPNPEFLSYVRKLLRNLEDEEADKLSRQMTNGLSETLLNGAEVKVDMASSLSDLLLDVIKTRRNPDAPQSEHATSVIINRHKLSVQVQIPGNPELNVQPSDRDLDRARVTAQINQLQEEISQLLVKSLPALHRDDQFSISLKIREPTIEKLSETLFDGTVTDSQAVVALAIVLKCYPGAWRKLFFWDAWLAVTIQLCLSAERAAGKTGGETVFPCVWIGQAFDAERLVSPEHVRYLLFGKDPVSKTYTTRYSQSKLCKATGIAFHAVGDDNPSIRGMKTRYGLDCDGDNPKQYCRGGLLMVNLIRCIGENDTSLNKNSCRGAWIAYTLKLIDYFSSTDTGKPVILLTKAGTPLTTMYIPAVCHSHLLQVPHPSMKPEEIKEGDQPNIDKVRQYLHDYSRPN